MMKCTTLKTTVLALAALALGASTASATIVFLSVAVDLSNISPASAVGGNSQSDNLWLQRNTFGETGATILEGWNNNEDVPVLTQTLSGLVGGQTYDIYANYVRFTNNTPRGGIRGSLDGSTFTLFNEATGTAGVVGFSELTGFANVDRVGLRGYLGTAVADGSGNLFIYIDDDGLGGAITERVWYDGASYEATIFSDTDNDGMNDNWEIANSVVVGVDDSALDEDANGGADGLTNLQEYQRGTTPQDSDTDDDGLKDGVETDTGTYVSPPTDTGTDPLIVDTDGDSFSDGYEVEKGSNPADPNSFPPPPPGVVEVAPDGIWT